MTTRNRSDLNRTGRYVQGGVSDSFSDRIGWWERRILAKSSSDVAITITARYHKRPDLLAADLYGRPTDQWVILQLNNIVDINVEFVQGKQIVVPTKQRMNQEFLTKPLTYPTNK